MTARDQPATANTQRPPIYRFGKDGPGTEPPDFALWLADRQAKMHPIADRVTLRQWMAGTWSEDRIVPLMAAIDARSAAPDHAFIATKPDAVDVSDQDEPWQLGRTQSMSGAHSVTILVFRTTHQFLISDTDR